MVSLVSENCIRNKTKKKYGKTKFIICLFEGDTTDNLNNNYQKQSNHVNHIGNKYANHVNSDAMNHVAISKNSTKTFRSMLEEAETHPIDEA